MARGNTLIDSALRKAIHPTILFITRMPIRSNYNRLFYLIRNNRNHIYAHRDDSNSTCVHQLNLDPSL